MFVNNSAEPYPLKNDGTQDCVSFTPPGEEALAIGLRKKDAHEGLVFPALLIDIRRVRRSHGSMGVWDADVDFRERDAKAESRQALKICRHLRSVPAPIDTCVVLQVKMALQTNAVDKVVAFQAGHKVVDKVGFLAHSLAIEVVIKKKNTGIGTAGVGEGGIDIVEIVVSCIGQLHPFAVLIRVGVAVTQAHPAAVFCNGLVDDIPLLDFALEMVHLCGYVILHDLERRIAGYFEIQEPGWVLPLPDECVTANVHAVRHAKVDDGICCREVEGGRPRHDAPELHCVLTHQAVVFVHEGSIVYRRT